MAREYIFAMQLSRPDDVRSDQLDAVATTLLGRTSRLSRLLLKTGSRDLSRTEVGLLSTLLDGQRTIGELSDSEALAQPSVSKLVDRLATRDLVRRERDPQDGRVVLVSISAEGEARLTQVRAHTQSLLRDALVDLPDADLATLVRAGEILEQVMGTLRSAGARR